MADFQRQVAQATQETDPRKLQKQQDSLRLRFDTLQKQFGEQQTEGAPVQRAGTQAGYDTALAQSKINDFDRRQKAAQSYSQLASGIDSRKTAVANEINAAIQRRQNAQQKYSDTQSHDTRENELALAQIGKGAEQKIKELNFTLYKNASERGEKIRQLYESGSADAALIDAGVAGNLRMQDVDAYFAMVNAKLEASFREIKAGDEQAFQKWQYDLSAEANNMARIFEGLNIGTKGMLKGAMNYQDTGNVLTGSY